MFGFLKRKREPMRRANASTAICPLCGAAKTVFGMESHYRDKHGIRAVVEVAVVTRGKV